MAAVAELRADRSADAPRGLVAADHRRQHLATARAKALGQRQRGGGQRRAAMDDGAQIAVVRRGGVAHHRVDLRRSAAGSFMPTSNHSEACGVPARSRASLRTMHVETMSLAAGGAGERAGDQHRRIVGGAWFAGRRSRAARGSRRGRPRGSSCFGPAFGEGEGAGAERPPFALDRHRLAGGMDAVDRQAGRAAGTSKVQTPYWRPAFARIGVDEQGGFRRWSYQVRLTSPSSVTAVSVQK